MSTHRLQVGDILSFYQDYLLLNYVIEAKKGIGPLLGSSEANDNDSSSSSNHVVQEYMAMWNKEDCYIPETPDPLDDNTTFIYDISMFENEPMFDFFVGHTSNPSTNNSANDTNNLKDFSFDPWW